MDELWWSSCLVHALDKCQSQLLSLFDRTGNVTQYLVNASLHNIPSYNSDLVSAGDNSSRVDILNMEHLRQKS